jgi:hypothetical protein
MSTSQEDKLRAQISDLDTDLLILQGKMDILLGQMSLIQNERQRLATYLNQVNHSGVESRMTTGASSRSSNEVNGVQTESALQRRSAIRTGSIKADILRVLQSHPEGLLALDILREINSSRDEPLQRTSLSPQLSRLQRDGHIANSHGLWAVTQTSSP